MGTRRDNTIDGTDCDGLRSAARILPYEAGLEVSQHSPRIALLTPYEGGNLGDAAIQDATIANIRLRLPDAQFSGITLNCDHFLDCHGARSFPLCGTDRRFYGMSHGIVSGQPPQRERPVASPSPRVLSSDAIKRELKKVPGLWTCLKTAHAWVTGPGRELRHWVKGYRFLRTQDLLIVSGGGQLDEEWGGPWGHPFALFKWAVLSRIAQVPYTIASVGACNTTSATSRFFLSAALRLATYRSYRDKNSAKIATSLLHRRVGNSVVPDLAFSLTSSQLPPPAGIRSISRGRTLIAISLIAYAKPGSWPRQDRALYDRYVQQMTDVVTQLLKRGYFLVIVCSALGEDEHVIHELIERLDDQCRARVAPQMYIPKIRTWEDLVASLGDVDFLIASRLHSAVLGFVSQRPTIAISFHPKVDWVMEDLGQTDYLLHIRDFTADDVIKALARLELHKNEVVEQIGRYRHRILSVFASQYDVLTQLAMVSRGHRK